MGMNSFATLSDSISEFVVKNIAPSKKLIRIFNYPIPYGTTRNLMLIPGVAEPEIKTSLLKGELNVKIRAGELSIVKTDIDLIQFSDKQKQFLQLYGIYNGLDSFSTDNIRSNIVLIGSIDGVNKIFQLPNNDTFINANFNVQIYLNGVRQLLGSDFLIYGNDNNAIIMTSPPDIGDVVCADYYITL